MDQITVSDIPLPGEEFPFKNEEKSEPTNEDSQTIENLQNLIEVKETITEDTDKVTEEILQDANETIEACNIISETVIENNTVNESSDENTQVDTTLEVSSEETSQNNIEIPCETPMTEEVTIETIEEIVEESTQPAKVSRSNSTIEAIKNDWSDGLTIEEVNDDTIKNSSPVPEPIITEPDKKVEEIETAAVIVVETVEEDLIGENVTIEIIDNSELEESKEEEKIDNLLLLSEVIDNPSENKEKNDQIEQITEKEVNVKKTVEEKAKVKQIVEEGAKMKQTVEKEAKVKKTVEEEARVKQIVEKEAKIKQTVEEEAKEKQTVEEETKVKQTVEKEAKMEQPVEEGKVKKPRGRPPKNTVQRSDNLHIPCHVLGRNVDNPTEDLISNGRTPPKPRLGVKVPYRFLTSQIVSKEEIANELVELTNKRNPDPDPPAGGDIFFASKLTQRLANKIASNTNKKKQQTVESTSGIPNEALTSSTQETTAQTKQNTIGDNKDLLAILEGDVDVDWAKEVSKTSENGSKTEDKIENKNKKGLDPEMERQIALKQLRELPKIKHSGRGRPRKYNFEPRPEPTNKTLENIKIPETTENIKQAVDQTKENIEKELDIDDNDLNLTPKPVTKTYSRKEAVLNLPDDLEIIVNDSELNRALQDDTEDKKPEENKQEDAKTQEKEKRKAEESKQEDKKTQEEEEGKPNKTKAIKKQKRTSTEVNKSEITLVSKRARIIKKKVIWDPAEIPKTKVLNAIRRAQAQEMRARKKMNKAKSGDETSDDEEETTEVHKQQKETKEVQKQQKETKEVQKKQETKDDQKEQQEEVKEVKKNKKIITDDEEEIKEVQKQNKEVKQLRKRLVPRKSLTKVQKKKLLITRPLRSLTGKLIRSTTELKSSLTLSKKKKQVMAEIAKSVRNKPKKTELDKLLGDEGAVNMLYSVKNKGKAPPKTYLTQKEIQNRKKQLRDVITQSSSQEDKTKALRKKESPVPVQLPARKKSRDSTRSSLQSPPPSPSFYSHRAEASRIIRRHSSSFSSDCSSPRRLSVDQNKVETETNDFQTPARVLRRKPEEKSKTDKEKLSQAEKRKLNVEMIKNFDKIPKKRTRSSKGEEVDIEGDKTVENKTKSKLSVVQTEYKELILKKLNNYYQITMNPPTNAKLRDVISLQMFQELNTLLTKLSKDDNCKIVLLNSNGKSFCNGLDFSHLIQSTAEKRTAAAQEMSKALKNFILTIAKFPKPLIASLHSSASLFGCTMLPYFDVVIAVDSAVLTADYSRVGHSPEGGAHLTLGPKTATDLLILGKKLTAKEAMKEGLINVVESKEKYEETVMKIVGEMSEKSVQSLIATKFLLRQSLLQKLDEALEIEQKYLLEFWPNSECQQLFKKLSTEQDLW